MIRQTTMLRPFTWAGWGAIAWFLSGQPAIAHPLHDMNLSARLLSDAPLTPGVAIVGLGLAFCMGAVHAFSPGHGKTMVAAYLIGSRGTAKHALLLGVITTLSHTLGVFALGILAFVASRYFLLEQVYPVLSAFSGLAICAVGWQLLTQRLRSHHHPVESHSHEHHHHHMHEHSHHHSESGTTHTHSHSHEVPATLTLGSLITLGIAGGMVPCPSALVLLLSAIALHQTVYGIVLVSSFSVGLAGVLVLIGLAVVFAQQWFEQLPTGGKFMQYLPIASAGAILLTGIALTAYTVI